MPSLYYDHSIDLAAERQTMRAWKRAMRATLLTRPAADSPTMDAAQPGSANLFDAINDHVGTLSATDPLRRAWEDISEYIRLHSDAEDFRLALGVSEEYLDQLFRDAMAEEATA